MAILLILPLFLQCNPVKTNWRIELEGVATSSSCRAVELTGDETLDLVIGAGSTEHKHSENGILAINGSTGEILWKVPCRDQVVGSAIFSDVNSDGIKDIFIGGRKNQLWSIDGATGEIIWQYQTSIDTFEILDFRVLNFFNPQFIPDQDDDQILDVIVSFGGFVYAQADDQNRPSGKLFILSGKTGKVLVETEMPDGKETYFSPVVCDFNNDGDPSVIFGSGGETIEGNLYAIRLSDLIQGEIDKARIISSGNGKGFIAPPVLVDITEDGTKDIVISSFSGRVMAYDGTSFNLIWEHNIGYKVATFSLLAPVDINGDMIVDFFGTFGDGVWNDYKKSIQVLIDGKTGKEIKRYNIGNFQYSSPLVADFSKDGINDVLTHNNFTTYSGNKDEKGMLIPTYSNRLMVFDFKQDKIFNIGNLETGSNLLSTPLIIDLDADGKLDVVTVHQESENDIHAAEKLIIQRLNFPLNVNNMPIWGAYMGLGHNCIY